MMQEALYYVMSFPFFWQSMGATVASSMFIGALLYNGDIKDLMKGMITIISYVSLLVIVTLTRVSISLRPVLDHKSDYMAYAGLATLFLITSFYIIGLILGVFIVRSSKKHKHSR